MTRFEQAAQKLRQHVLAFDPDATGCNKRDCALSRLRHQLYGPIWQEKVNPGYLDEIAMAHGFTKLEANGIMNGWDNASGYASMMFRKNGDEEYERGKQLGADLFNECHTKGTAMTRAEVDGAK